MIRLLQCRNFLNGSFRQIKFAKSYANQALEQLLQLKELDICSDPATRGLIVGVYADESDKSDGGVLTPTGWRFNVQKTNGKLLEHLRSAGPMPKRGETRLLVHVETDKVPYFSVVAVVGLGKECLGYNPYEIIDEQKEAIRRSVGAGVRAFIELDICRIEIESCGHAESAAEGAALGIWVYQDQRTPKKRFCKPSIDLYSFKDEDCDIEGWRIGLQKAAAQNLTRQLQEMASNMLTPTVFAQTVVEVLCKSGVNVEVKVEGWAESQRMNAFLSVGKASCEPPIFLELSYFGTSSDDRPIVLIGEGTTFDAGGLCLKHKKALVNGRGAMTGGAVVVATIRAIAKLRLPINIRGLVPLCENMVGCNAYRPGDIVKFANGLHAEVQHTDHDSWLIIADALLYAQNFCPKFIVDVSASSRSLSQGLCETAAGIFTNSEILWQQIKHASMHTGDRVWRMPLWDYYKKEIRQSRRVDIVNLGPCNHAKGSRAAAFLRQFVPCGQWMHIDVSNVILTNGKHVEYLRKGMAGRPTRTLIEFIAQTLCKDVAPKQEDLNKRK